MITKHKNHTSAGSAQAGAQTAGPVEGQNTKHILRFVDVHALDYLFQCCQDSYMLAKQYDFNMFAVKATAIKYMKLYANQ